MKRIRLIIASLMLLMSGAATVLVPAVSYASPKSEVCSTLGAGNGCGSQPANGVSLNRVVTVVISTLSIVVGIAAVIMVMVSGFKYVTSGGDSSKVQSAKNSLMYAIVGLVVAFFAQAIVKFVLNKVK
ncbi:MAG TPA: pilin [Candidatus Saccharimonadales bacterium]|nr:pilin [Candidatus Saccharimonadales bacterium]